MSVAAEELRDQLSQTAKNADIEEADNKTENKGINHFATFPWLYGILRKCRETIGTKHTYTLDGLLYALVKELTVSIKDCYSRPNRAGKLRDIVCQMLVYFNMIYRDLKVEYMDNNNTYLHLMTELLAIYLDLEIKASKRGVHSLKKIGQFMTTALYTHLGQSEDHIIEAILKAKLITKSAGELCAPVLFKVLNDGRCFIGDENAYVRFLLAFKLLHKITRRTDRFDVTKMAMRKLDPAPELVRIVRRMNNIFPAQKIMDEPITVFLMNAKFDFIKAKLEFLRTGSISLGSTSDFYPDKPFGYSSWSNSTIHLLKNFRKDEQKGNSSIYETRSNDKNKKSCSTDFDLDPSIYRISLRSEDNITEDKRIGDEDDGSEVEFLGTKNKGEKPAVLITLDSDEEVHEIEAKEHQKLAKSFKDDCPPSDREITLEKKSNEQTQKRMKNLTVTVSDSFDMKSESYNEKMLARVIKVPENEGDPDSGEKNLSTNHDGGLLPSMSQSPEHGVIDSTNNFIDFDENFRTSMRKKCHVQCNNALDESATEVSSSLDFVDSTAEMRDECCYRTQEYEISSTRDKSEPYITAKDDVTSVMKDLNNALNPQSYGKNLDIASSYSPRGLLPSNISRRANDISKSIITGPLIYEKDGVDKDYYNSVYSSNMELNKCEKFSTIQNYIQTVKGQQREEPTKIDSMIGNESIGNATYNLELIERTNENRAKLGTVNVIESNQSQQCLQNTKALGSDNEILNQSSKEGKISQMGKGEIGSKNFTLASGNLNKLIGSSAKKVNFENVAKSYKIVKSNRLKTSELSRSPVGGNKDASEKGGNRTPKFIKIDKSGFIGSNLKVKERVKFVSKSLDFRTSKPDGDTNKRGREERGSTKTLDGKSVNSRTRSSQCVPIIFKKIDETRSQGSERKRKSSQRGVSDGKSPKTNQTTKRRHRSHSSNVIKTDINMKSTLKHINPSSIPQFAADISSDRKRKYTVVDRNTPKINCVDDCASVDSTEKRTVEIKFVIPENFLELNNTDTFQGHGKEIPVISPSTVHFPSNHESTSCTPIPRPDDIQEDNFNQFPSFYRAEQTPYCEKADNPEKIQDDTIEPSQRFFVSDNVEVPSAKFESQKPNSIPYEQGYQEIFPVLNCGSMKNSGIENGKLGVDNQEEVTDLVEHQGGLNINDGRRFDSPRQASSLDSGMAFSGPWSSGKLPTNTPRDLVMNEVAEGALKDVDEELREFVEPWEGPQDCCPDDDEFFLSTLPDPQKLFSEEDFSHLLDVTFPTSNLSFETVRPEDFGHMDTFDDKNLCDLREERDIDMLESTFNENFFVLHEKFTGCDDSHTDETQSNHYESCKKSARLPSPESQGDDQPKPCFEKGRRSSSSSSRSSSSSSSCSSSGRKKAGSSRSKMKPNSKECIRSKLGGLMEGIEQLDKKKLRSDSVAYHTRSISQKGIPIEYTLPPPKRAKSKRNRPS